jgi:hypothetical protein
MADGEARSETEAAAVDDAQRTETDGPVTDDDGDSGTHPESSHPVRRGSVDIRLRDGERIHHDEAFVRYEPDAFVVAADASFPTASTDRYPKERVAWLDVRHPRR